MFGEDDFLAKFNESYESIQYYMRRGWVELTLSELSLNFL